MTDILANADELATRIEDGSKLALFKDSGVPAEAVRALIRRGVKDLHIVTVPTSGLLTDLLIGAGCVKTVETSGVSLGEFGPAPCFTRAVKGGEIEILDATCPAVYAGLQAGEKGIPFMPFRGLLGSDILKVRPDFKVIENPFAEGDMIVTLPAIKPDVSLIHVPLADTRGNVWIGRAGELKIMAHASAQTFVTAERIVDEDIMEDERLAAAAISSLYISAIAPAPQGAWPLDLPGYYRLEPDHLRLYAKQAATREGFEEYLAQNVLRRPVAAE